MSKNWTRTQYPGVRFREHPSRKHGVRADQYFSIYYRLDGKRREEGLGWASQGWTAKKASAVLSELQEAIRKGEGAATLREKRRQAGEKRMHEEAERLQAERDAMSFSQFWQAKYWPANLGKSAKAIATEKSLYERWLAPMIGQLPLRDISAFDLEQLKKTMLDEGRAPRSAEYALAVVRQVFNKARDNGLYQGDPPTRKVGRIKKDNRRQRFLGAEEATRLLETLAKRSSDVHDQALLSLNTGLRFGEIASLCWVDIDMEHETILVRDPKSGRNRMAFMTKTVKMMLASRPQSQPSELVFPAQGGGKQIRVSSTFKRVINDLYFNEGIDDRRQQVCFHTLRHTYASWLALRGTPVLTIKELMGHETLAMTERYSHLAPDTLRKAVKGLEEGTEDVYGRGDGAYQHG